MFIQKIVSISPNEIINDYIREMFSELGDNLNLLINSDKIFEEMETYKPAGILLYYTLKTPKKEDIYEQIRKNPLLSNIPILLFSFDSIPNKILETDKSAGYVKLPTSKEEILINLERVVLKKQFVLMVDDSTLIHTQLRKILTENNFGILEAYNGKEALDILSKQKPDIIISDIEMPIMNGYEFCKAVKGNPETEKIPLIILSSLSSGIDVDRGFDAGANDYLTKPIDVEELTNRLNVVLSKAHQYTREKILIVDDSRTVRNMMVQGFEQQGFKTYTAENGLEGLEKARKVDPDLITTDYDMPVMNGWEFCQKLGRDKKLKNIPTIMLTSRESKSDRAKSAGVGIKAYLTKPFTTDKLIVVVERVLAEKKMQKERELLKFYVSDAAMEAVSMVGKGEDPSSHMRAKEIFATVLFSDIASFTPTCEKLAPKELIELLNEYFDLMCTILKKHDAIIDKFIGDAILAMFGRVEDGAYRAVKAGKEMVDSLKEFNKDRETPLHMRVGINSGKLYIGDIGSKYHRRDFTVIGDNVNTGQRLESKCKHDGVLISESTYDLVKDYVDVEKVGPLALKGKSEEVFAYQVLEVREKQK